MNTPDEKKDWAEGAVMLLQLSGNKIMYHNIAVNPKGKAEFIKGKLQKYLDFRLQQLTHEQVAQMQQQVDGIVAKHPIIARPVTAKAENKTDGEEFKAGKRGDHDLLPDKIKALYVENLDIVNRMREVHLRLRLLSTENATCPDSERYPFLKELIALDKRLHENWDTYDHYVATATVAPTPVSPNTVDGKADAPATEGPASEADAQSGSNAHNEQPETTAETAESAVYAEPVAVVVAKATTTAKKATKRTTKKTATE